jgi:hypothetical protein
MAMMAMTTNNSIKVKAEPSLALIFRVTVSVSLFFIVHCQSLIQTKSNNSPSNRVIIKMTNKRTVWLVCAAVVLAGAYMRYFFDWHKPANIQIFCEKSRQAILGGSETPATAFHFTNSYPLTSIEVVEAEDARTNKYPHALWHLVAAAGPVPTSSFVYGAAIPGMKPEISTADPEPLQADTTYSLMVEAAKNLKGQLTFQPR